MEESFQPRLSAEEDRDASGLDAYLSWIWLYGDEGFFNLKYEFINADTDGSNWENRGHLFSLNLSVPRSDRFTLQVGGEAFFQDFSHTHTVFGAKRDDSNYAGLLGLS